MHIYNCHECMKIQTSSQLTLCTFNLVRNSSLCFMQVVTSVTN